jgi:hypothetical protein
MNYVTYIFVIVLVTCCLLLRTSFQSTTVATCYGVSNQTSSVCGGHGVCVANDTCSCVNGYDGIECEFPICFGLSLYDSQECHCTSDLSTQECNVVCQRYNNQIPCSNHGKCVSPNTCVCNGNYTGSDCSVSPTVLQCNGVPATSDKVCNGHGQCQASGNCMCDNGFSGLNCSVTSCYGVSSDAYTVCGSHGECISQDHCSCEVGYTGVECNIPLCFNMTSDDVCQCTSDISNEECRDIVCANKKDSICSGNGQCVGHDRCKCDKGYKSKDCSLTTVSCWGIDELNSTVCSGHGKCNETDKCTCYDGYSGSDCSESICYGESQNVCSGHGTCTGTDNCVCNNGYYGDKCDKTMSVCFGINVNNAKVCNGHGNCTGTDECSCNSGYVGEDCAYPVCYGLSENECQCTPDISTEECSNVCNGYIKNYVSPCSNHGKCVHPDECQCNDGYIGSNCSIVDTTCFGLNSQSSIVCSGHGQCTSADHCSCMEGYSGAKCSLTTTCYGVISSDAVVCSGHGACNSKDSCVCDSGWSGLECKYPICYNNSNTNIYNCLCTGDISSSECSSIVCARNVSSNVCSGYGSCLEPDACLCNPLFTGSNCSRLAFNCFGTLEYNIAVCSGRGNCIGNDYCDCDVGYTGDKCSIPTCFNVPADSHGVCSEHGNCNGPDECICSEGYTGYNCSIPICFGFNASNVNVCSGAGLCIRADFCQCITGYSGEICDITDVEASVSDTPTHSQSGLPSVVTDASNSIKSSEVSDSDLWVDSTTILPSHLDGSFASSDTFSGQSSSAFPQVPSPSMEIPDATFSITSHIPSIETSSMTIISDTADVSYSSDPVQISSNVEESNATDSSDSTFSSVPLLESLEVSQEESEQIHPSLVSSLELSDSISIDTLESNHAILSSSSIAGISSDSLGPTKSSEPSESVSTSVKEEVSSPNNSEEVSQSSDIENSPQVSIPAVPSLAHSLDVSSSYNEADSSVMREISSSFIHDVSAPVDSSINAPQATVSPVQSPVHSSVTEEFSSSYNNDVSQPTSDSSSEASISSVTAYSSVVTDISLAHSDGDVLQSSNLSGSSEQSPSEFPNPVHSSSIHGVSSDENSISTSETNNEVSQSTADSSNSPQVTVSPIHSSDINGFSSDETPVVSSVHSSSINGFPSELESAVSSSVVSDSSDIKASPSIHSQSSATTIESSFDIDESSSEVIEKPTIVVVSSRNIVDGGVSSREQDIYIEVDATPGKAPLRWQWSVFEKENTIDLAGSFGVAVNTSTFIVPPRSLDAGKKYIIKVQAQFGDDSETQVFKSWTITMSTPPSGGQFDVTPSEGTTLDTIFTVTADSWEHSNGEPLQYQLQYLRQGEFHALDSPTSSSSINTILPSGTGTNHELTLRIIITSSDGDHTTMNKTLIVHPLTSKPWETIETVSLSTSEANIDFIHKLTVIGKEVKSNVPTSSELSTATGVVERLTSKLQSYVNNFISEFDGTDLIVTVLDALDSITSNRQLVNKKIADSVLSTLESVLSSKKITILSDIVVVALTNIIDNVATLSDVKSDQLIYIVKDIYLNISHTGRIIYNTQKTLSLRLSNLNKNDATLYSPVTLQTNRVSARALSNTNQVEVTLNQALGNHPDLSTYDNLLLQYILYSYYPSVYEVSDKSNFTLIAPIVKVNAKTSDNHLVTSSVNDLVTIVFPAAQITNATKYFQDLDSKSQVSQVCTYWNGNKWTINEDVCYTKSDSSSDYVTCECSKFVVVSVALITIPETVAPGNQKRNGLSPGGVAGITIAVLVPVLIGVILIIALAAVIIFKYATGVRMNTKKIAMQNMFNENYEMHNI